MFDGDNHAHSQDNNCGSYSVASKDNQRRSCKPPKRLSELRRYLILNEGGWRFREPFGWSRGYTLREPFWPSYMAMG